MIRLFDFLPAADADLREIIRYSRKQWGVAQTHTYVAALKHGIEELAKGEGFYKTLSEVHPELRIAHCGHHYIFCLNRSDAPARFCRINFNLCRSGILNFFCKSRTRHA